MDHHLIFSFYILLFIHSTIGYGFLFSRIVNEKLIQNNLGYMGLVGFFFISLVSIFTSFFVAHDYLHNSILHILGLMSFVYFFNRYKKINELKFLWVLIFILWIGLYLYKNHDDFPYYHLTYALNLSENSFAVGMGKFSHGFRTFSSLFYFHSILYMPYIKYYLFHSGPFLIILFFNFIIISRLINSLKFNNLNILFFFSLLSLIFINVAFYRIAEHGTDRSAQIILVLIFLLFFEIFYFEKDKEKILTKLYLLTIIVFLASSMKAIYYLYLSLLPIIFFKKKLFKDIFLKKNFLIIFFISISFFLNLTVNYFNTGCLLYPAKKTCLINQDWSFSEKEVNRMSLHYEWWSKAGGGPGYVSKIEPKIYVKNFNWVSNWIDRHFFNKVSDTLLGIIFISMLVFLTFKFYSNGNKKIKNRINYFAFLIPILFLVEWFLNHPAMRYGGYVLFAIPIFLLTSMKIEKYVLTKKIIRNITIFFVILSLALYNARNISRLVKESDIYQYDLAKSPYFFVENVSNEKTADFDDYEIYSPKNGKMCWASKTPCSYNRTLKVKNFLWMKMVY
jgi:hypothetical protein